MVEALRPLEDFGTRSLVTHAIMTATFAAAIGSALLVGGRLGLVSFVAFVNFTAGVWVCQSVHSLGNSYAADQEYEGVIDTLRAR
jgi:hypothetical protein